MQGKACDDIQAMQFERFCVYKPAAIFGEQKTHPVGSVVASLFKPLSYLSNSIGINMETIARCIVMETVRPAPAESQPESVMLENADMIKLTGRK